VECSTHGTGIALLGCDQLSGLAKGLPLVEAVREAEGYVPRSDWRIFEDGAAARRGCRTTLHHFAAKLTLNWGADQCVEQAVHLGRSRASRGELFTQLKIKTDAHGFGCLGF